MSPISPEDCEAEGKPLTRESAEKPVCGQSFNQNIPAMSDTPRTDAELEKRHEPPSGLVWADFARELERENARYIQAFRHTHIAGPDGDRCAQCGLDLRDPIHASPSGSAPAQKGQTP